MKKKSSNKKTKLKINSFENSLFKKLTNEELKEVKAGADLIGPGEFSFSGAVTILADDDLLSEP